MNNPIQVLGAPSAPKIYEDAFWRDRVCEALGLKPGTDNDSIFDAMRTHRNWKERAARVLGVSHKTSSANLLAAHDQYMQGMKRVNQNASAIQNQRDRQELASSLVNTLVQRGLDYRAACHAVRRCYPNLLRENL